MKSIYIILLSFMPMSIIYSQNSDFLNRRLQNSKSNNFLSVGIGMYSTNSNLGGAYSDYSYAGTVFSNTYSNSSSLIIPPIIITGNFKLNNRINIGPYINLSISQYRFFMGNNFYPISNLYQSIIGLRFLYHFPKLSSGRFCTYFGGTVGWDLVAQNNRLFVRNTPPGQSYTTLFTNTYYSQFAYEALIGSSCKISERYRAHLEMGVGISLVNFGIDYQLDPNGFGSIKKHKERWY
jgi:hypothetical protein